MNQDDLPADRIGLPRFAGWVRRSRDAMLTDLEPVDCGSLDVLLYCADDLAVARPGDVVIERSRR